MDRQKQTIIEYSVNNGFNIDEFISDVITGGTKADNRPNYHNMKKQFRNGDTLIISDVDRLGRNADDVIMEIKDLQSKGIRVVALDVPFLNDWEKMNDDSLSKMIIDVLLKKLEQEEESVIRGYYDKGIEKENYELEGVYIQGMKDGICFLLGLGLLRVNDWPL